MITVGECKTQLSECKHLANDPDISAQRATAIMAICRSWLSLEQLIGEYNVLVLKENSRRQISDRN